MKSAGKKGGMRRAPPGGVRECGTITDTSNTDKIREMDITTRVKGMVKECQGEVTGLSG